VDCPPILISGFLRIILLIMDEEEKQQPPKEKIPEEEIPPGENEAKGILTLEELGDIPLKISVQLGNTKIKLEDLIRLQKGSIIGIEKLAGEPLEFYIGKKLAAKGEVIVINEKYGLRLTDIINPEKKD
jgi:flagellar motor switch protein FliN/FliY